MKVKKKNIISLLLIVINPILGYIFTLLTILENRLDNFKIVLISFSVGILGYAFNPFTYSDNFRYFKIYSFSKDKMDLGVHSDLFLDLVSKSLYKLKFDFFWIQFICVFLTYFFLLKSFKKSISENLSQKNYILYFILFYLSISFNDAVDGMRDYLAISICIYGYVFIYQFNKKKGYLLLILSVLIHYMTWIFLLVAYLSKFINKKRLKIILILSIFLGKFMLTPIIFLGIVKKYNYFFPNFIYTKFIFYFDSISIENLKLSVSKAGLVYEYILFTVTVIIPMIYLLRLKVINDFQKIIFLNCILVFSTQNFYTISYRISIIILPMVILDIANQKRIVTNKILPIYICSLLFFLIQIFSYRKVFFYSYKKIFYKDLIQVIVLNENEREFVGKNQIFYRKDFLYE